MDAFMLPKIPKAQLIHISDVYIQECSSQNHMQLFPDPKVA